MICAGDLSMSNICQQCQYKNLPENRFCTRCGSRLQTHNQNNAQLFTLGNQSDSNAFDLAEKENFIGREKINSIVLDDEKVSKKHAVIYHKDNKYFIEDLNSKNGVFVNGIRIEKETINYFKDLAKDTGIPYQNLINLYLRDCVQSGRKISIKWASAGIAKAGR